ncbi:hypothetical protein PHLCEN_2v10800 [Hermanssonia centrifuga]|uniref:Uncharacterized protein n=1 Tax=Hermanssonia centrifuga TaxID=98765 RepID=A0A2R6NLU2_9APHY|nr:hypothetical protein PHLCEN_2v10800 [Hermanssonia centrifuga]
MDVLYPIWEAGLVLVRPSQSLSHDLAQTRTKLHDQSSAYSIHSGPGFFKFPCRLPRRKQMSPSTTSIPVDFYRLLLYAIGGNHGGYDEVDEFARASLQTLSTSE